MNDHHHLVKEVTDTRDRAIGALVGLAAGDAVGTTLEFARPGSFAPIDDLVGGGPFGLSAGQWTDDTSMAMCLAESILDTGEVDPADQLRRYVAWRRDGYWSSNGRCFDIGSTTARALSRFERDGSLTDATVDQHGAANGSLMRLAPVPIRWHTDVAEAARLGGDSSRTTHPADRPVDACRVYSAMLAALIQGTAIDEVLSPDFWEFGPLETRVDQVVRGSWRHKEPPEIKGTGYVVDALEAALWAVAGARDFRDAILRAANLGDDADTTAAIAGQLAGARWGVSAIPPHWRAAITDGERIRAIAGRLADVGAGLDVTGAWDHDEICHGYWVEPGRVLAGEYPGDRDPHIAHGKVNLLIDHGIRTFVDLTDHDGLDRYDHIVADAAAMRGLDVRHVSCPIPDMGVLDQSGYDLICDTIHAGVERGGVYMHCWGGIGRTGTVAGCLLVDAGSGGHQALARLDELRAATRKAPMAAPQTPAQIEIVLERARRAGR